VAARPETEVEFSMNQQAQQDTEQKTASVEADPAAARPGAARQAAAPGLAGWVRQPWFAHTLFIALWALLLALLGLERSQLPNLPWLAWGLGLVPALAGFTFFLAWRKEGPLRWLVLTAGETLGVVLGSILLAGLSHPLIVLALWPIAWAALRLPLAAGLGVLGGATGLYLAWGSWETLHYHLHEDDALGMVAYAGAWCGIFLLLRVLEQRPAPVRPAQPAPEPPAPPRPEMLPPFPSTDDALHQELQVARDIQVTLLLASSPRLPGWEASTSFLPARELGGDLYDFVELDPTTWGIMIGDVSGKGIPAALHMAVARTLFRMEARHHPTPALTLAQVNQSLIEQVPQGCVTLLYAHLDITDGSMRLANAGHNYPLVLDESARELPLDGLPLGIDKEYTFAETTAQLKPGDALVFYTDGVVEAVNDEGEFFGFERLQRLLAESTIRRPRTLTRQIVRAVRSFTGPVPQSDDITLVVLRRRYADRIREMAEVARDVLGPAEAESTREQLEALHLPPDASAEVWRAAILTLGSSVRDRWGQGPSRELMQQLFLALEGL
jgi:sigma-B regulation protein RsbU (phosphoserine phosphatase)